jgi:imidazolonepropionase
VKADLVVLGISEIVTAAGKGARRGHAMRELKTIKKGALAVLSGRVAWIGAESDWNGEAETTVHDGDCAVVAGLIDPHTHCVWAGDRLADFEARASGIGYEAILAAGGGIRSTIRATAEASVDELVTLSRRRVGLLTESGATTIEIKSGYGFVTSAELAMLEAIRKLSETTPARIVPSLLIHIPPAEVGYRAGYVEEVCRDLIPQVVKRRLALTVDIFIEKEAWHIAEAEQILGVAKHHGLSVKLHSDQFHSIGGVELGIRFGALSIDHLEATTPAQIAALAASSTIATILPGVSLHLGVPAAPCRGLIDAGAAVAIGTDLNPGSSPLFSTAAALALAVRLNGLTPQEALMAGTVNAASALGLTDVGRLEVGCPADFLILHSNDWRDLVYTLGTNPVREVWIAGRRVQS